jgi:hypothetical protein
MQPRWDDATRYGAKPTIDRPSSTNRVSAVRYTRTAEPKAQIAIHSGLHALLRPGSPGWPRERGLQGAGKAKATPSLLIPSFGLSRGGRDRSPDRRCSLGSPPSSRERQRQLRPRSQRRGSPPEPPSGGAPSLGAGGQPLPACAQQPRYREHEVRSRCDRGPSPRGRLRRSKDRRQSVRKVGEDSWLAPGGS